MHYIIIAWIASSIKSGDGYEYPGKIENAIDVIDLDIGDKYHYLLVYGKLNNVRRQYIQSSYFRRPNSLKFCLLLNASYPGALS